MFRKKETLIIEQTGTIAGRHVSLRPTKLCLSIFALSVAIWIGAANYQVNVAYAICFWLVGFLAVAALLTQRQLLGLNVQIEYADEVFAGQTAEAKFHIMPSGKRTRLFWLHSEIRHHLNETDAVSLQDEEWQRCEVSGSLKTDNAIKWHIPITQRGYFPRPLCLRLATSAPFGLFHAESHLEWHTEAVAYAAPLAHNDFGTAATPNSEETSQRTGVHGEDIAFLKNHQDGMPLQHISWKTFAKRGELLDKVFDEPPPAMHSEIISYQDYPAGIPVDKLASLLTHRVLQADKLGAPYTLELPNLTLTPQNGLREKCLNALALM
ncbi:DUF58 domain-containing protein [Kingella negevensis]|uniref:DUF58 domain-containing protein n=1 Tax=Kingella negevensis TaxID=1522312 RepID=A0A238HGJ8_9NEIS|nr:DUF58 domain-containing protein [Kingella negevensis]MDK4697914.1 DUF58 domain-containing protein [Kingella negevensis]SNB74432.1 Uncharacterised protein [Kingella negevensis]